MYAQRGARMAHVCGENGACMRNEVREWNEGRRVATGVRGVAPWPFA